MNKINIIDEKSVIFAGSGRDVITSSDGIFMDLTPPYIQELYHLDWPYSDKEPVHFQGTNTTIAVYLTTMDNETKVSARGRQFKDKTPDTGLPFQNLT